MKKAGREGKIAVVVGTVTDDPRIFEIPKLNVSRQYLFNAYGLFLTLLLWCILPSGNC